MRYAKRKNPVPVDYTSTKFQPCWTCSRACGGCEWSALFQPVPGWVAIPVSIPENGEESESYKIIYCPKYEQEERK